MAAPSGAVFVGVRTIYTAGRRCRPSRSGMGSPTMQAMTKHLIHPAQVPEFEEEFITGLKAIFEEKIVFNQLLGLQIT